MENSEKKTVLITGASGNLGQVVLNKFRNGGWKTAPFISPRSASTSPGKPGRDFFSVDLLDEEKVSEAVDKVEKDFGCIEMAVFTAGGFAMGSIDDTEKLAMEKMLKLNFYTSYIVARKVHRLMEKQGGGVMVFIGARPAVEKGTSSTMLAYSLSKSLVLRLAEAINENSEETNIRAVVIVPGIIDTAQNRSAMPDADTSKWIHPSDIADKIFELGTVQDSTLQPAVVKMYGAP